MVFKLWMMQSMASCGVLQWFVCFIVFFSGLVWNVPIVWLLC